MAWKIAKDIQRDVIWSLFRIKSQCAVDLLSCNLRLQRHDIQACEIQFGWNATPPVETTNVCCSTTQNNRPFDIIISCSEMLVEFFIDHFLRIWLKKGSFLVKAVLDYTGFFVFVLQRCKGSGSWHHGYGHAATRAASGRASVSTSGIHIVLAWTLKGFLLDLENSHCYL